MHNVGADSVVIAIAAATISPEVQAAQETAHFTRELAIYTGALALATFLSIVASITIQVYVTRRDDRLRREAADAAEKARREQYAHSEMLQQREHARVLDIEQRAHKAARELMIVILKSYERYMTLLIAMPLYNMTAPIATAQSLFERAFATDTVHAIPSELRTELYDAIVTAHEALNYAQAQQAVHAEMTQALSRDDSQRAADAAEFTDHRKEREQRIAEIFPSIRESAERAKRVLSKARAALGDQSGPLPALAPA